MGQTLPNGIYLPAEGERNCYDGLEGNWRSLDGLISTVAGKASATHTHGNISSDGKVGTTANLPLITGTGGAIQAGSFGTSANTFCEGNDSRLSDARTPVAHTHTKSDVTDLFNSANTWTGDNTFTAVIRYKTSYTLGNPPQSSDAQQSAIMVTDSAGTNYLAQIATFQSADATGCRIAIRDKFDSTGFSPSGSNRNKYFYLIQNISNQGYLKWDGYINNSIYPLANNTYNLGNSTYKWKTLNGINPGALSLPKGYTEEGADKDYINIASVIQTLDGTAYSYTLPDNGWICVRAEQAKQVHVTLYSWYFGQSISHPTGSTLIVSVPFRKNDQITLKVNAVTLQYARFYPMQGNV